jgi:hypothetical protein
MAFDNRGIAAGIQNTNAFLQNMIQLLIAARQNQNQQQQNQADFALRQRALELQELNAQRQFQLQERQIGISEATLERQRDIEAGLRSFAGGVAGGQAVRGKEVRIPVAGGAAQVKIPTEQDVVELAVKHRDDPKKLGDELLLTKRAVKSERDRLTTQEGIEQFAAENEIADRSLVQPAVERAVAILDNRLALIDQTLDESLIRETRERVEAIEFLEERGLGEGFRREKTLGLEGLISGRPRGQKFGGQSLSGSILR